MYLEVNQPGLIPGKIQVDNEEDAEKVFSILIDAQNIPGVDSFEAAVLHSELYHFGKSSDVIWKRRFDDYF